MTDEIKYLICEINDLEMEDYSFHRNSKLGKLKAKLYKAGYEKKQGKWELSQLNKEQENGTTRNI
jgi:hypothetical protein